ncbi:MAG: ABC transporter permease [Acidimicrobiales bacterium]
MTLLQRFKDLPAWARFSTTAALGILVLSIVQSLEAGGASRLTADTASGSMLRWSIPILLAGLGGLYAERAGIVNIGLEGMMILGTWFGAWGALQWGPWGGLAAGLVGGGLGGLVHAIATVGFGVDHIISGVAINITAPGVTRFLSDQIFTGYKGGSITQSPAVDGLGKITVPVLAGGDVFGATTPNLLGTVDDWEIFFLSDIAGFMRGFMAGVSIFTVIAIALVPISAWLLWRTRFGLRLRIAGENPHAGESLGVNIYRSKYVGVVISGALAGLAGAFIAMELTGFYRQNQTTGRGFIGLAALIFGNWKPGGILAAAFLFGYPFGISLRDLDGTSTHALLLLTALALAGATAWAIRKQNRTDALLAGSLGLIMLVWYLLSDTAPRWLPSTMPFAIVVLVLVFANQRLRPPAADGQIYRKGET